MSNFTKFSLSAPQEHLQTKWKYYHKKKKKKSGTELKNEKSGEREVTINSIATSDVLTSKYLLLSAAHFGFCRKVKEMEDVNMPEETQCKVDSMVQTSQQLVSDKALNTASSYLQLSHPFANGAQF